MRHQRETWVLLMDKLAKERAAEAQAIVSANADAITEAPETSVAAERTQPPLPAAPRSGGNLAPARRNYPAFSVRPAPVSAGLSVQG
jgi:hypothetical protein